MECLSKYNLERHQQTNKQCIRIQHEMNIEGITEQKKEPHECIICGKTYSSKQYLQKHVCKPIKKVDDISKLIDTINKLHDEVKQLKENKSSTIINNNSNNTTNNNKTINYIIHAPINLDPNYVKSVVDNEYKKYHYKKGTDGFVDFLVDNVCIKDGQIFYNINDVNRRKFVYKDKDGNIRNEFDACSLLESYTRPVTTKNTSFYYEESKTAKEIELSKSEYAKIINDSEKMNQLKKIYKRYKENEEYSKRITERYKKEREEKEQRRKEEEEERKTGRKIKKRDKK